MKIANCSYEDPCVKLQSIYSDGCHLYLNVWPVIVPDANGLRLDLSKN